MSDPGLFIRGTRDGRLNHFIGHGDVNFGDATALNTTTPGCRGLGTSANMSAGPASVRPSPIVYHGQ